MAAPYISCPGRVLLGEQQVLSKNLSLSKTITYATSCRNNVQYKNSSRLRGTFLSSSKKVEAGYNPCNYYYLGYYFYTLLAFSAFINSGNQNWIIKLIKCRTMKYIKTSHILIYPKDSPDTKKGRSAIVQHQ